MLNSEQTQAIRKTQAVLLAIKNKQDIFFNIAHYKEIGLVKSKKVKTHKRSATSGEFLTKTSWILTPKGNRILDAMV